MEGPEDQLKFPFLAALLWPATLLGQAEPTVLMIPRSSLTFSLDYAPTSGYLFLGENSQRRLLL